MITICLQYHDGDYGQAMALARFIAQLERSGRDDFKFVFFARWDADTPDRETFDLVAEKFVVAVCKSDKYRWTGWPGGPNGLAKEVLETAPEWLKFFVGPGTEALLMLEPDCVPLARDWLDQMLNEWIRKPADVWQIGAWRDSGGAYGHINGNCLIRSDIRDVVPVGEINQHLAWDCQLAPHLAKHWRNSDLFLNHFQSTGATIDKLPKPAVLVHGYKDSSALNLAKTLLL